MSALKKNYNKACNAYLSAFCCLTGLDNGGWVGSEPGGILQAGDYFIGMADLIVAVENKLDLDAFLEWYDYGCIVGTGAPNLKSWIAGCPRKSQSELDEIEATRKRIMELEDELKEMLKNN
jgi:hypothetical protein